MNRATVLLLTLGFGSTLLTAQVATKGNATAALKPLGNAYTVQGPLSSPENCPISLTARQTSAAFARQVGDGQPGPTGDRTYKDIAQKIRLSAIGPDSRRIVGASLIVRGYSSKTRYMPVLSSDGDYDAAKVLNVRFSPDSGKGDVADVAVPGLTAVGAIDLNSVTYADGSTWKVAQNKTCRAWIDGLMLISGH